MSTASTRSISGLYTFLGHLHTRTLSGFDTLVTPCTCLKYFGVLYCSYFEYSQYQNCLNRRCILGASVILRLTPHCFDVMLFGKKRSRLLVGAHYFRGEQLEFLDFLDHRQYFGSIPRILCEHSQYFGVLSCGYSMLQAPKYFGFNSADAPAFAVFLLLILPVFAVFRPSVLLILPALAVRNVLDTPSMLEVRIDGYL